MSAANIAAGLLRKTFEMSADHKGSAGLFWDFYPPQEFWGFAIILSYQAAPLEKKQRADLLFG